MDNATTTHTTPTPSATPFYNHYKSNKPIIMRTDDSNTTTTTHHAKQKQQLQTSDDDGGGGGDDDDENDALRVLVLDELLQLHAVHLVRHLAELLHDAQLESLVRRRRLRRPIACVRGMAWHQMLGEEGETTKHYIARRF